MDGSLRQLERLLSYLREYRWHFIGGIGLVLLMSYTNGVIPVLIRNAIDKGIVTKKYSVAFNYGLLILLVAVFNGIFSFTGRYLLVKSAQHAVYYIRMDAFKAIQRHRMEFLIRLFLVS